MGAPRCGGGTRAVAGSRRRIALPFLVAAILGMLGAPPAAQATFHLIKIREVYSGTGSNSSYVELQMYESGQNFVSTHFVRVYNATGSAIGTFTFTSDVAKGENQRTILVGDDGVQAALGVTPDLVSSSFDIPASGGAVCWESLDCVSWGNFSGSLPSTAGTPDSPSGIPSGMALQRSITGGTCTNQLDAGDDTGDSATDFSAVSPHPRNNASQIEEGATCTPPAQPPTAVIDTKPANPTNATSATFTFHSSPAGATFECRLDAEAFAGCISGITYSGPLSAASHTFQVKATNANGTGSPANYTWTIDLTAPVATIDTHPANPSPGTSAAFTYHSNETGSTFECSLAKGANPDSFSSCLSTGKTYTNLENGTYTFKVRAKDKATNQGSPTEYEWEVDNSLADLTPPETTINSKPPDPSESSAASFTYESNEPGSTFECKLDGASFTACPTSGIGYQGLAEGPHTFEVRATDSSLNTDPTPAGFSWSISLPEALPPPPLVTPPPAVPETTISSKPGAVTRDRTPTFKFRSSVPGSIYQCKLDKGAFRTCRSPFTTKSLTLGRHMFQVRASSGGTADPTPAHSSFKVVGVKKRRRAP